MQFTFLFFSLDWSPPHSDRHIVKVVGQVAQQEYSFHFPNDIDSNPFSKYVNIYFKVSTIWAKGTVENGQMSISLLSASCLIVQKTKKNYTTCSTAFRFIMFMYKIFLKKSFIWQNNSYIVDLCVPTCINSLMTSDPK